MDSDGFLRLVLRSGLVDQARLQAALRTLPAGKQQPDAIAEHLVKQGHLSRFQARKLLKGTFLGLILGPYQVLSVIGRGGMGTVYLARDGRNGHLVALKVLPPSRAQSGDRMLARFVREAKIAQLVTHPNIAHTYGAGQLEGVWFIAMEFIPGKSLQELVSKGGPMPAARAARLLAEVAGGLEHAHSRNIIHRDLKPANILVTPNDHAKVLDFGLSYIRGETGDREVVGGQGYVVGTMDFIAPEQVRDPCAVDGRSDVYSLGCTLYYALSGQVPFPGGNNREKMKRQLDEKPRPVMSLNPAVPPGFAALVERMMDKDPARRFPSAAAVQAELLRWQSAAPMLPLDQPGERAYDAAIAQLTDADLVSDSQEESFVFDTSAPRRESVGSLRWIVALGVLAGVGIAVAVALALRP